MWCAYPLLVDVLDEYYDVAVDDIFYHGQWIPDRHRSIFKTWWNNMIWYCKKVLNDLSFNYEHKDVVGTHWNWLVNNWLEEVQSTIFLRNFRLAESGAACQIRDDNP